MNRNASCNEIINRVMNSQPVVPTLHVQVSLNNFNHSEDIKDCLVKREPFGLKGECEIIFIPEFITIIHKYRGEVTLIKSPDKDNFVNQIKLYLINNREFYRGAPLWALKLLQ